MDLDCHGLSDSNQRIIVLNGPQSVSLSSRWVQTMAGSNVLVTANWDAVVEQAIEAAAGRDPLGDLLRILREHAPDIAGAKDLLPRTRTEALQMIAILISLRSLWVATHQSDQHLSTQDEMRLAHAMGAELRRAAGDQRDGQACMPHR